jgi:hypothetical protein
MYVLYIPASAEALSGALCNSPYSKGPYLQQPNPCWSDDKSTQPSSLHSFPYLTLQHCLCPLRKQIQVEKVKDYTLPLHIHHPHLSSCERLSSNDETQSAILLTYTTPLPFAAFCCSISIPAACPGRSNPYPVTPFTPLGAPPTPCDIGKTPSASSTYPGAPGRCSFLHPARCRRNFLPPTSAAVTRSAAPTTLPITIPAMAPALGDLVAVWVEPDPLLRAAEREGLVGDEEMLWRVPGSVPVSPLVLTSARLNMGT